MRVYEFAKKHEKSSKEIMAMLQQGGFPVASHMAVLQEDALLFLQKKLQLSSASKAASSLQQQGVGMYSQEQQIAKEKTSKKISGAKPEKLEKKEEKVVAAPTPIKVEEKKPEIAPKKTITPVIQQPRVIQTQPPIQQAPVQAAIIKEAPAAPKRELILEPMTVTEFAERSAKPFSDVVLMLLKWGVLSGKNYLLNVDLVSRLATHYQLTLVQKPTTISKATQRIAPTEKTQAKGVERLPVIVVMGHVDHGKTTLLDYIRNTRVAAREKGGITQHLGAYEAVTPHGSLVFLDTPGHEAFVKIRQRGIKVADLAILVVAADDGVMPQTIEAIKQAQAMQVPIIVAINKVDKVEKARIEVIKRELSQHGLLCEEWGGDAIMVPISAKTGAGVDTLLQMLTLQAQIMELKANIDLPAQGYVLEAKLEKGRGPVATVLCQNGKLKIGDYFVAGTTAGKVSSLVDSYSKRLNEVGPSVPVQVAGFKQLPQAGDSFEVVDKDTFTKIRQTTPVSKAQIVRTTNENVINLIIKTDTDSSAEALLESIAKLNKKAETGFSVIYSGIGQVSESDVALAADTDARIITLHVRAEPNAASIALTQGIIIEHYDIIYKLLEALAEIIERGKKVPMVRTKTGEAIVRKVFDIKNLGVIAGCYVKEGVVGKDGSVIIWRGRQKVGEGKITSLQRDKKSVKEVHAGYECAFIIQDLTDWAVDDRVEVFQLVPAPAK